ncbi:hypothetical protein KNO15_06815 [Leifsonia shinshuensis]|uniref:hypothetical protein n=1 Tax=Leifsonia shinshuensis TaxID=150026 RepID=UPI001F504DEE|nr:hypothetical protein [Leifsonia shinshuensis]MCI0156405.1 hypothetical protein [Leifsonia shinshuensis]
MQVVRASRRLRITGRGKCGWWATDSRAVHPGSRVTSNASMGDALAFHSETDGWAMADAVGAPEFENADLITARFGAVAASVFRTDVPSAEAAS